MSSAEQSKPLFRRVGERFRAILGTRALYIVNTYLPCLGAGIRVVNISPDATRFDVQMPLRPWNQNYFGTHFGGSLYAMCDPFFALILTENLGADFLVWDKSATIRFIQPGRGRVSARFEIPPEHIEQIREKAKREGRVRVSFSAKVVDDKGEVVAEVDKLLSIRRKSAKRPSSQSPQHP